MRKIMCDPHICMHAAHGPPGAAARPAVAANSSVLAACPRGAFRLAMATAIAVPLDRRAGRPHTQRAATRAPTWPSVGLLPIARVRLGVRGGRVGLLGCGPGYAGTGVGVGAEAW